MNQKEFDYINTQLVNKYGKDDSGRPKWRLVENTPALTERRYGTFTKWDEHGNWLGETTEVREVPKYNYIPFGIYIIEQLYFTPNLPAELAMAMLSNNGTYEPRWPFMDREMNYLEPTIEGCDFIVEAVMRTITPRPKIKSLKEESDERKASDREKLDDEIPELAHGLVHGSAVKHDETKQEMWDRGESSEASSTPQPVDASNSTSE